jgi:hypothetical protein
MSDEQQGQGQAQTPEPRPIGEQWGEAISADRQVQLQGYLDRWEGEAEHGDRNGPFHEVKLTGAEMFWLAARTPAGATRDPEALEAAQARLQDRPEFVGLDLSDL